MKNLWIRMITIVGLSPFLFAAAVPATTPTEWVKAMLDKVMSVQTDPTIHGHEFRGKRKAVIKKIIAENFDFDAMAEATLGPQWERLSENQAKEFKSLFEQLFQDSYTRLVLDFLKREQIEYRKETIRNQRATVTTTIVRINDAIPVKYFLHRAGKSWFIEDVEVDGVSIVNNYRRAFARVIKRGSYQVLVQRMRTQLKSID